MSDLVLVHPTPDDNPVVKGDLAFAFTFGHSKNELHSLLREDVEAFQLEAVRERFGALIDHITPLKALADRNGIAEIETLDAAAKLMFAHTVYKSYPMSFIERNRFDRLTVWLNQLTTADLSAVDASHAECLDDWLELLDNAGLYTAYSSGTSGKLSFLPRTKPQEGEIKKYVDVASVLESFGDASPGFEYGAGRGTKLPILYPAARKRFGSARTTASLRGYLETPPEGVYYLYDYDASADIASLSGRIRVAEQKGELGSLKMTPRQEQIVETYRGQLARKDEWFERYLAAIETEISGAQIAMIIQPPFLYDLASRALQRDMRSMFARTSMVTMMGGTKGIDMPDDWRDQIDDFLGFSKLNRGFGMTETYGCAPTCSVGNMHLPVNWISFLLDYDTGVLLPRTGRVTGRLAIIDLLQASIWGGFVTGDQAAIDWDGPCGCGFLSPYIVAGSIARFSDIRGVEDDKILCSGAPQAQEAAVRSLLAAMGVVEP